MFLAASMASGTLAATIFWREDPSLHMINTGKFEWAVDEIYIEPSPLMPGADVEKKVRVENTGGIPLAVRVRVDKVWGFTQYTDENGKLKVVPDPSLSTDNIILDINTTDWEEIGGWYYYKGVIAAGEKTPYLFTQFHIAESTDKEYANAIADIIVNAEVIQAGEGASEAEWSYSLSEWWSEPAPTDYGAAHVTLKGVGHNVGETVFEFEPSMYDSSSDLFPNFKDLIPGADRTQIITVKNEHTHGVEIFLKAEAVDSELLNNAQHEGYTHEGAKELVTRLLREYATVTVKQGARLIYSGPVWGNYLSTEGNPDSMRDYFMLGYFLPNQEDRITVELHLSEDIGKEYADLWGHIQWHWFAREDDNITYPPLATPTPSPTPTPRPGTTPTPAPGTSPAPSKTPGTPGDSPKTGDGAQTLLWVCGICAAGGIMFLLLALPGRRKARTEE
jgi:alternate signal-mediated exported protein